MQKTSITLWPEQIERLRDIGAGSLSEGIRRLLAEHDEAAVQPEREVNACSRRGPAGAGALVSGTAMKEPPPSTALPPADPSAPKA